MPSKDSTICKNCGKKMDYLAVRVTAWLIGDKLVYRNNKNLFTCPHCGHRNALSEKIAIRVLQGIQVGK